MTKTFLPILTAALLAGISQSQALILISEVNSNGADGGRDEKGTGATV